ncbi:DUF305 domain-containing protein [Roseomonas harenae]|uniref:DUF305 domain-containing protein n=1 Tax=Muricoccus harenae TaxID=2692566 RepID=UPI0013312187|nr:DUF305 domain-containing protein [Roseomonas harenae]
MPPRRTHPANRCRVLPAAAIAAVLLGASPASAMVSEGYEPGRSPVLSHSYSLLPADALEQSLKADRDYLSGMRPHHAGALSMSEEYLADPQSSSPLLRELAQAIIQNQRYEIALLEEVARKLDQPPRMVNLGFARFAIQPAGTEGLAQRYRIFRAPIPGPLTPVQTTDRLVTMRDVQFAKAMTTHHQGALEMARAYQANPDGRNTFLGLLNVDIITDQAQEIALMRRAITAYPGDADAVPVPASMIHGMEGMSHGAHGGPASPKSPHAGHGAAPTPHAGHGTASSTEPGRAARQSPRAQRGEGSHAGHGAAPPTARTTQPPGGHDHHGHAHHGH